jgi:hypothetical protein
MTDNFSSIASAKAARSIFFAKRALCNDIMKSWEKTVPWLKLSSCSSNFAAILHPPLSHCFDCLDRRTAPASGLRIGPLGRRPPAKPTIVGPRDHA